MIKSHVRRVICVLQKREKIPGLRFDMESFYRPQKGCGTVACIAGHAAILAAGYKRAPRAWRTVSDLNFTSFGVAKEWLGLTDDEASSLFYGAGRPVTMSLSDISVEQAIEVLKHLLKTGKVDWQRACELHPAYDEGTLARAA